MPSNIKPLLSRLKRAFLPDSLLFWGILLFTIKAELSLTDLFTVPGILDNTLTGCTLLILLYYAVKDWSNPKEMLLCAIGFGIICLSAVRIRNFHLLITAVTVLALRNQNVKKAVRLIFHWKCLFFAVFALLAILFDLAGIRSVWMRLGSIRPRFLANSCYVLRLGYRHYTAPGGNLFILTQMWGYLHFGSISKKQFVGLFLINFLLYELTSARLSLIMAIVTLLLLFVYQNRQTKSNPLLHTGAGIFVPVLFLCFLAILLTSGNWPDFVWKLNKWMSTRLAQPAVWYTYRGLSWIGNSINGITLDPSAFHTKNYTNLDCLYTGMAVWYGILPFLVICVCFFLLARKKGIPENIMILSWAIMSIAESDGLNCYMEFPLILTALAIPKTARSREKG